MDFYATLTYGHTRPYMPGDVLYMLPASSWARGIKSNGQFPAYNLPAHIKHVSADCGGFVASRIWGDYKYSPAQYVDWLTRFPSGVLKWAATMDYCCELPLTLGQQKAVIERQTKTTLNAWLFWDEWRHVPWAWIPTIQGWEVEDYIRHAQELKPLINQMQAHYQAIENPYFRVGIGTLCARADTQMINAVVRAVTEILPNTPLHLWGVKLGYLKSKVAIPENVASFDSAAWSPGGLGRDGAIARRERLELGIPQRKHDYTVALPNYQRRIADALARPKQMSLF